MGAREVTHRLIVSGKRNSKRYIGISLAETYAMRGEHTHFHPETCYNGTSACDKFVEKRLDWNGSAFVPSGGENGDK